jgi:hypothetical protein
MMHRCAHPSTCRWHGKRGRMSRSSGPGSPIYFMCHACRRARARSLDWREYKVGTVKLTGRTRAYTSKGYTALGVRGDRVAREYKCSCGHVGWSNHNDLKRMEAQRATRIA